MIRKILIIFLCLCLVSCASNKEPAYVFSIDDVNNIDYQDIKEFDFDLHSDKYMLVNLSDLKVLYGKDINSRMYPASMTKLLTLDTILHLCDDLNETSSISEEQMKQLIKENASIAYLTVDEKYTILELLYALILPSGADAAIALQNYLNSKNIDLVEQMNKLCEQLQLKDSHFTNPTGLHDDNLYTTLDDLFKIVLDVLQYDEARKILKSTNYRMHDNTPLLSTLLRGLNDDVKLYGGKTGTTDESGQSVIAFYEYDNRNYMLIVANAMGHKFNEFFHMDDIKKVFSELYKNS